MQLSFSGNKIARLIPHPRHIIWQCDEAGTDLTALQLELFKSGHLSTDACLANVYRGMGLDRLQQVLENGIDAYPTNEAFFADQCISKALEYGGNQMFPDKCRGKIVLAIDESKVERSYTEVPSDTPHAELLRLENRFGRPPILGQRKGYLWFSRFRPVSQTIRGIDYAGTPEERSWGYWIPGNAIEAIRYIIIIAECDSATLASHEQFHVRSQA